MNAIVNSINPSHASM